MVWSKEGLKEAGRKIAEEAARNKPRPTNADRWIPVSERLPGNGTLVLTYSTDEGMATYYYSGAMYQPWWDTCVTHWMPLPEPPEEG